MSRLHGKRITVTGGAGFLGSHEGLRRTIDWYVRIKRGNDGRSEAVQCFSRVTR